MKLVFASGNRGKIREALEILGEGFELMTPAEAGILEDIPETGRTLRENSLQKARYLYERTGMDCFADDTGLEVDCLGGAPGIHTARYAGEAKDPAANIDKLLREMEKAGGPRTARFRTVVTLILGGETHFFEGVMEGSIAMERCGTGGFGYDPVFVPAGCDMTAAELREEEKNAISHRGKALRAMAAFLTK
jgi:XTP/dITP diphosphohydrolase